MNMILTIGTIYRYSGSSVFHFFFIKKNYIFNRAFLMRNCPILLVFQSIFYFKFILDPELV
jgi:hypothetical protein